MRRDRETGQMRMQTDERKSAEYRMSADQAKGSRQRAGKRAH